MRCPYCGHSDSKVTNSREADSGIRRRRECRSCGVRFTTYERVQSTALLISKQDNRREEFNREKLVTGIRKACAKRPISSRTIEKMVEDIEAELQHLGQGEVPAKVIGEMVMERLRTVDRVAYICEGRVVQDGVPVGWIHVEVEVEHLERVVRLQTDRRRRPAQGGRQHDGD